MRAREDDNLEAIAPDGDPRVDASEALRVSAPRPSAPLPAMPAFARIDGSTTFFRMIELRGDLLGERLAGLWSGGAGVEIGRCRLIDRPSGRGSGVVIRGCWRRLGHRTALPVEIELWPHLERWTVVTLAPRRRVRLTRRYYKGGHHLLDELTIALADYDGCVTYPASGVTRTGLRRAAR
jgi:hypothetical protein